MEEMKLMYEEILVFLYNTGNFEACEALLEIYEETFFVPKNRWRPKTSTPGQSKNPDYHRTLNSF